MSEFREVTVRPKYKIHERRSDRSILNQKDSHSNKCFSQTKSVIKENKKKYIFDHQIAVDANSNRNCSICKHGHQ